MDRTCGNYTRAQSTCRRDHAGGRYVAKPGEGISMSAPVHPTIKRLGNVI